MLNTAWLTNCIPLTRPLKLNNGYLIPVKVLRGDSALEWAFAHAFKQHFYVKKVSIDSARNPIVTFSTLEVLSNRTKDEWL